MGGAQHAPPVFFARKTASGAGVGELGWPNRRTRRGKSRDRPLREAASGARGIGGSLRQEVRAGHACIRAKWPRRPSVRGNARGVSKFSPYPEAQERSDSAKRSL